MIPIVHVFYSLETRKSGFQAIALYPIGGALTEIDFLRGEGLNDVLIDLNHGCAIRKIDVRAPVLTHKVTNFRLHEILRTIRG